MHIASKIENKALNTLEYLIDDHLRMQYEFYSSDKEMAWDGYIWTFKRDGYINKEHYDDKLPVQIKGHVDKRNEYMKKEKIMYSVDLEDLYIYFNDRGVLYFQIFMSEYGKEREIFYASLFPSKIKSYLDKADKKGNKKSIRIPFVKLVKKPEKLYYVAKQFSRESKMQGFGSGQIVENTIMLDELYKVTGLSFTAVGVKNEFEFLERLSTGDVCIYGTQDKNGFKLPLEWRDDATFTLGRTVHKKIRLDETVYYNKYQIEANSEGDIYLIFSENLQLNLKKGTFNFKAISQLKGLVTDARFLLHSIKCSEVKIGKEAISYCNVNMPNNFQDELNFYLDLNDTLKMIDLEYTKMFVDVSVHTKQELLLLVQLRNGYFNDRLTGEMNTVNWKLEDGYIPLLVARHINDEMNDLKNALYTSKFQIFLPAENDQNFKIPAFSVLDASTLGNLYEYRFEKFYKQIDNMDINQYTFDVLNDAGLKLIQAYDLNTKDELLELALHLFEKMMAFEEDKEFLILNCLQVKKRLNRLTMDDQRELKDINSEDTQIMFAKSVLLDEKEKSKYYYEILDLDTQKFLAKYPIFHLYRKLISR